MISNGPKPVEVPLAVVPSSSQSSCLCYPCQIELKRLMLVPSSRRIFFTPQPIRSLLHSSSTRNFATASISRTRLPLPRSSLTSLLHSPSSSRPTIMSPPTPPFPSFTTVNFYSGGTLNRLSWLRDDASFLNTALQQPNTRIVVMQNLNPLTYSGEATEGEEGYLATMSWKDVKEHVLKAARGSGKAADDEDVFGPAAYGVEAPSHLEGRALEAFGKATASIGPTEVAFVFLGVDEEGQEIASLPGQLATRDGPQDGAEHSSSSNVPAGTPYFALSLTYKSKSVSPSDASPMKPLEDALVNSGKYDFVDTRALGRAGEWPMRDAALVAQARALLDWNERNHFCPSCSRRQYSVWGGYKRACTSSLTKLGVTADVGGSAGRYVKSLMSARALENDVADKEHGECPTTTTLSNCCYPRTDPVVIMGVLSPDGERMLLGRQKKWPPGFWSCLAGFLEVGESLEEAVRREVLEEVSRLSRRTQRVFWIFRN